jgi:isoleucyl-tRNA synthetase
LKSLKSSATTCRGHRAAPPYIDQVTLKCDDCGGEMHRTPEVIDCWYDSGSMPFAQWHYPFENKEIFEANFPAAFISEAIDQTRGWFYTLLAIGTLILTARPLKTAWSWATCRTRTASRCPSTRATWSTRGRARQAGRGRRALVLLLRGAPWLPSRFSGDMVSEVQRKFMGTLWNTYAFFTLYASIDGYDPTAKKANAEDFSLMTSGCSPASIRWWTSWTRGLPSTRSPKPPAPSPRLWMN